MKLNELKNYKDKKVGILGFGKEGKSSLRFFQKLGFSNITVLDKNKNVEQEKNINYILGENYLDSLNKYDLIIKSPGISPYNEKIRPYISKITSQAQIFTDNYEGKIIGITGTKGKSTTSTVLFLTLKQAGYNTKLVGNIGNPVLDEVDIIAKESYDFIVFEMSSYMLEGLKPKLFIGYINNVYICHLDWHSGEPNYQNAKFNILKYSENKIANIETKNLLNDLSDVIYFGTSSNYVYNDKTFFINSKAVLKDENIKIKGEHNRINITGIIAILDTISKKSDLGKVFLDKTIESLRLCLETFTGLSHRIENIGTYNGIIFIDDAIATTPESTVAAIKTYEHNIGTLLLGGQDSGFKFEKLVDTIIKNKIPNIVLFPDTGEKIFGDLSNHKYETKFDLEIKNHKFKILKTKFMKSAIEFSYKNTPKGKICLLSNAAPSFSLWSGYIEKGLQFQDEVKKYISK